MRRLLAALVASVLLGALAAPAYARMTRQQRVRRLLAVAHSQLGTPYQWGAESPRRGFDCSGLVQWAFRKIGIFLPRTTWGMLSRGKRVYGPLHQGDAVFFLGGEHVAIYLGHGQIEEAPHTGARVRVARLTTFFEARRFIPWAS